MVNDLLHKISRAIVNEALENNSMIVFGNLKGIGRNSKGRRFNGKLNNGFPYYKLSRFIEFKATWLGIKVLKMNERNTSELCHKCGLEGVRVGCTLPLVSPNRTCKFLLS